VARVASIQNTNAWAKAGVMIRQSTAANSPNIFVFVTPTSGVAITWRLTAGGTTNNTTAAVTGQTAPKWLKITRMGNVFAGYRSDDGTTWTQVGTSQTISMTTSATMGMAVTSHADGTLCTSTMDNVTTGLAKSSQDLSAEAEVILPTSTQLMQNYPNPFNPETTISYQLSEVSHARLTIRNTLGQEINKLVDRDQAAGRYSVRWNGRDVSGNKVASGIYFYMLETNNSVFTKKLVLLQ